MRRLANLDARSLRSRHLEVLLVHPCNELFLFVAQARVHPPSGCHVIPASHGVDLEPERLLDRHRRQVPVHLKNVRCGNNQGG